MEIIIFLQYKTVLGCFAIAMVRNSNNMAIIDADEDPNKI